jgi:ribose 1,5-bisphosphokinase
MSEAATIIERGAVLIGPGRLVLVVGPSGAGKDTLLRLAQAACAHDATIEFPRRIVTREASAAEDNLVATAESFAATLAAGGFALHWDAHGHRYGLPRAIDAALGAGRTVVVNVSRTVVGLARHSYAAVTVVMITAPAEILAERLAARGRASDGAAQARIGRSIDAVDVAADLTISNIGNPADHAAQLVAIIRRA